MLLDSVILCSKAQLPAGNFGQSLPLMCITTCITKLLFVRVSRSCLLPVSNNVMNCAWPHVQLLETLAAANKWMGSTF